MTAAIARPPESPEVRRARFLALIVAATFFMEYLDTTVIATALPQMAHTFGTSPNNLSIGMTAYMLALAVFIPVSGWVADRCGARTVFASAIALFTFASLLCGAADSVVTFTAARLLQGLGGAMMVPVGRLIVIRSTEKAHLMRAISTITWPAIFAPVIGPPIGGFITTYASWRWIFLLNAPFGIICGLIVLKLVRNEKPGERRPLDVVGFFLGGAALTCLLYGTELAGSDGVGPLQPALLVAASVVFGLLSYRHSKRHAHPLIDYSTLKVPTFSVTVLTGSLSRIGIGAVPYLLPLLLQIGFGMTAFRSGLFLLVSAAGNLAMKAATTPIFQRFGFRPVATVNVAVAGLSMVACGFLAPSTPTAITLFVLIVYGLSRSLQFSTLATLAYADIAARQMSAATALWSVAQQMTIGMGIAAGAVALRVSMLWRDGHGAYQLADFRVAFVFAGILALVSMLGYARLAPDAGQSIRSKRAPKRGSPA